MKALEIKISSERLHEVLCYEESTGIFTWNKTLNGNCKKGDKAGCLSKDGYVNIRVDNVQYKSHRLAWFYVYEKSPLVIDHINGIRSDNKIQNLREVSYSENRQNVKKCSSRNATNLLGVCKSNNLYLAKLVLNKKVMFSQYFDNKYDAYDAYLEAKRKFHSANTL